MLKHEVYPSGCVSVYTKIITDCKNSCIDYSKKNRNARVIKLCASNMFIVHYIYK